MLAFLQYINSFKVTAVSQRT